MKCELKYVGHEYIKCIKNVFTKFGFIVFLVVLSVYYFVGDTITLIITITSILIFIVLAYKEGNEYCKNRKLHNDSN